MKTLFEYLNESLNDFFAEELYGVFMSTMDYLYNEGVAEYQDDYLKAYYTGKLEMNYKDFVNTTLSEFGSKLPDGPRKLLGKYINSKAGSKAQDIEELIVQTLDNFVG